MSGRTCSGKLPVLGVFFLLCTIAVPAGAQSVVELRDRVRGATSYSAEIYAAQAAPAARDSRFSPRDVVRIGLHTTVYDWSNELEEVLMLVRIDGRLWVNFRGEHPVTVQVGDELRKLQPLRSSHSFIDNARFVEKLEVRLPVALVDELTLATDTSIYIDTDHGRIEVPVTNAMRDAIAAFAAHARARAD